MGVPLGGQVQGRIGGIQVRVSPTAVGEAVHGRVAEDHHQPAAVTRLAVWPVDPLSIYHGDPLFACCPLIEVALAQQQVPRRLLSMRRSSNAA